MKGMAGAHMRERDHITKQEAKERARDLEKCAFGRTNLGFHEIYLNPFQ
jgi:hypothetical protein